MNRERGLSAYRAELGLDPICGLGAGGWLDLCCGSGRALIEAAATASSASTWAPPSRARPAAPS